VIHACPKERVERCDLLLPSSVPSPSHPPSQIHHQCTYNDEPITKTKKKVNDLKETNITFSANTKSDAKKEKKKREREKKEEKSAAESNQMQVKILLCLLQKTPKQMQISLSFLPLSLSLSLCPQDTQNQHKKDYDKNNKTALF
jgi:hypothetical protein